jgi:DNA topoisomerase-2
MEYKKFTQREHVLERYGMYIGDITNKTSSEYLFHENNTILKDTLTYNSGILKIFDEILVNAIDQTVRDSTVTFIKVSIRDNTIEISNDGNVPAIEIHPEYQIYIPELIFGNLLTSSNYDDTQERLVGGLNGIGAKATNIFSSYFKVHIEKEGQVYDQEFYNNMSDILKPIIHKHKTKKNMLSISFIPDFQRFGCNTLQDNQTVLLLKNRVYECACCTRKNVTIYLNDEKISIKDFTSYAKLFSPHCVIQENERWQVAVFKSSGVFEGISFVNGIRTYQHGTHMDYIVNQIIKHLSDYLNKKNKNEATIKSSYIKDNLFVIINCKIVNPVFSSQSKEQLISKSSVFKSQLDVSDSTIKKLIKLGITDNVLQLAELKTFDKPKSKKTRLLIPKLEDAIHAGTKHSQQCTLILCEGDSAKSMVMAGLSVVGRTTYGIFPLKGKLLNVQGVSTKKIMENEEIMNLCHILGLNLQQREDKSKLRYGHVIFMTDQDSDGFHIKGLLLNFFRYFWMSDFFDLCSILTPLVKCIHTKSSMNNIEFYDLKSYNTWKQAKNMKMYKVKYLKGLGSNTRDDAKEIFKQMKTMHYTNNTEDDTDCLDLGFNKKKSDARKQWIMSFDSVNDDYFTKNNVNIREYMNNELIVYSIDNIKRSIPCIYDGLKVSQRKVLFAAFKRNLVQELKVAQFSGYVSEQTAYHHGEMSLNQTIINMAQDYVGSNNINLLMPCGMFGTRLMNGNDFASPRYIFTCLSHITRSLYMPDDDKILTYLDDDGTSIEPEMYCPILPMILINGCVGIATGFSTSIPCFNPLDISNNIKHLIHNEPMNDMIPWYRGFKGTIVMHKPNQWETQGILEQKSSKEWIIHELPIGISVEDYKTSLIKLEQEGHLTFDNHSDDIMVKFVIKPKPSLTETMLNLRSIIYATNMHLLDEKGHIKKYDTVSDILLDYYHKRLDYYITRKETILCNLQHQIAINENKKRFMHAVVNDTLIIFKRKLADIISEMKELNYNDIPSLLDMKIHLFSEDKLLELHHKIEELKHEVAVLTNTTIQELWLHDLNTITV